MPPPLPRGGAWAVAGDWPSGGGPMRHPSFDSVAAPRHVVRNGQIAMGDDMKFKRYLAAAALVVVAGGAGAQEFFTYPTSKNFCPRGLWPVSFGGVISCGVPTTSTTYDQAMAHPASRKRVSTIGYIPAEKGIPTYKGLGN